MFTTLIVQPIFNILTLVYALLPGHNFGVALIIFTIITRFAFFPLLKKQLKHTRAIKLLQPELKKIKEQTKGDKTRESAMVMELYKERAIKPMGFIGLMAIQIVLFLALFSGLNRVVKDTNQIYEFSYPAVQSLSNMQEIKQDISKFDNSLLGFVDLERSAIGEEGFYVQAFLLVLGSSVIMFFQIRQTSPSDPNARKLRDILKEANSGKEADTSEMNAAMARNISLFMPLFIFVISIGFPAALALYWFVGNLIGYLQQYYLLKQDEFALTHATAEVVSKKPLKSKATENTEEIETKSNSKKVKNKDAPVKVTTYTAGGSKKPKVAGKSKRNKRKR